MDVDLRDIMRIARRRGWLIVLTMAIAGSTAFAVSSQQDPQYSATATLLIVPAQTIGSNELTALQASRSIAETYRLLITTGPVLERVVEELNLPYDAVELDERVSTAIVGETQVIEVTAIDGDPDVAALIATTVVQQFQVRMEEQNRTRLGIANVDAESQDNTTVESQSPQSQNSAAERQVDFLSRGLGHIEASLSEGQVPASAADSSDPVPVTALIEIWEPARVPSEPFEPQPLLSLAIGLIVGLLLGIGLIVVVEFLDNTVKPEHDLQSLVNAPVLSTIGQIAKLQSGSSQLFTVTHERSGPAEAMRLLRTNLDFASASEEIKTLVITSPGPGEGKSTLTANLGVVMAQAGAKTVILDGDLRKPTLHKIFGVQNDAGVTTLITHPDKSWTSVSKQVATPNLFLVPSGPIPPNPSDLLSSERFNQLLERIRQESDIILIDSPPVHSASDSLSLAGHADGLLLVSQSHKTRTDALRGAAQAARQGRIRLVGLVLNRLTGSQGSTYYGEYYESDPVPGVPSPGD